MNRKLLYVVVLPTLVTGWLGVNTAVPREAEADITRPCSSNRENCRRPFVFGGKISAGDPVNLVFAGGRSINNYDQCNPPRAKSPECVEENLKRSWENRGDMESRTCDSGGDLAFRRSDGTIVKGESNKSLTTSSTCKDEYHIRIWGDQYHGHELTNRQFGVGAVHHEVRCAVGGACDHKIDMDWEVVENVAVAEFERSTVSEPRWCVESDYYPLGGSAPPGKSKNNYKTGFPSRISWQTRSPGSEGCRGA